MQRGFESFKESTYDNVLMYGCFESQKESAYHDVLMGRGFGSPLGVLIASLDWFELVSSKTGCNQLPSVSILVAHIWQFQKTSYGPVLPKKAKKPDQTGLLNTTYFTLQNNKSYVHFT